MRILSLVMNSEDYHVTLYTLANAFNLDLVCGQSFSELAKERGVSKAAYSKRMLQFQRAFGLGRGGLAQCRKCRIPVKIMAMSRSFAAAMTSSSRTEPPG
jgi:hypothetical protein